MDAGNRIHKIADLFQKYSFDAVMVGNAAAALNGAPVTTLDIDFAIEQTPENYRKIMLIASELHCKVYELQLEGTDKYLYRLQDSSGVFFLDILHKISGFDDLSEIRKNSVQVDFGKNKIMVASLKDILHSKRTAARPKDLAVIPILEATKNEIEQQKKNAKAEDPNQETGMSM